MVSNERETGIRLLRDSAAAFVAREMPLSRMRGLRGRRPEFDRTMWARIADQGWTGLLISEKHGGFGQGYAEMASVIAALGSRLSPEPVIASAVFAGSIVRHAENVQLAAHLLPLMASGALIPVVAWQGCSGDIQSVAEDVTWVRSGARASLTGTKRFVRPGTGGDGYIVSAQGNDGLALFWIPKGSAGLQEETETLADGTFSGRLRFERVDVGLDHCLARGESVTAVMCRGLDEALVMSGVELLAVIQMMLSMTVEYLCVRKQFGKPIGSFQALQHRVVDLRIQEELLSATLDQAIKCIESEASNEVRSSLASRVKARACHASQLVAREAIQMHGAIGTTDEYDLGLYVRRSLVLCAWLGNGSTHRRRFASLNPIAQPANH